MNQTQARTRARQYIELGFVARAQTMGGRPTPDEEWHVFLQAADRPRGRRVVDHTFYEEFDVRVTPARDAWVREYAAKPDETCHACGYSPQTLADLRDHIITNHQ